MADLAAVWDTNPRYLCYDRPEVNIEEIVPLWQIVPITPSGQNCHHGKKTSDNTKTIISPLHSLLESTVFSNLRQEDKIIDEVIDALYESSQVDEFK